MSQILGTLKLNPPDLKFFFDSRSCFPQILRITFLNSRDVFGLNARPQKNAFFEILAFFERPCHEATWQAAGQRLCAGPRGAVETEGASADMWSPKASFKGKLALINLRLTSFLIS